MYPSFYTRLGLEDAKVTGYAQKTFHEWEAIPLGNRFMPAIGLRGNVKPVRH